MSLGWKYSILEYTGAFEHSLQVLGVIEPASERTILVKCRHDVVNFTNPVRKIGFELFYFFFASWCFGGHFQAKV